MNRMILGGVAIATAGFAAGLAVAQAMPQTGRTPQFENADVKVWRSVIAPNSPLPLHRHEHPRVLVALTGGTMAIVEQDGSRDVQKWETGNAYWLPANKPGTLHQDVNIGDKPIVVVVAELKGVS
jgi:quercetin dioxygenase-like cupin family protein